MGFSSAAGEGAVPATFERDLTSRTSGSIAKSNAVVLMLCDQPFGTRDVIARLVRAHRETIVPLSRRAMGTATACRHCSVASISPNFARLEGAAGAKQVIAKHLRNVHLLPFPEGKIDIDTPEDFARLQSKSPGVRRLLRRQQRWPCEYHSCARAENRRASLKALPRLRTRSRARFLPALRCRCRVRPARTGF